jgi:hypothetical protein
MTDSGPVAARSRTWQRVAVIGALAVALGVAARYMATLTWEVRVEGGCVLILAGVPVLYYSAGRYGRSGDRAAGARARAWQRVFLVAALAIAVGVVESVLGLAHGLPHVGSPQTAPPNNHLAIVDPQRMQQIAALGYHDVFGQRVLADDDLVPEHVIALGETRR